MRLLKIQEVDFNYLVNFLEKGGVIIYPTETLYGIGVKYDNKSALKKVFELKKRPLERVFSLIVNLKHLEFLVTSIPPLAEKLIKKYWPGPLTLLLPAKDNLPDEITKNNKIALRMPGESFALDFIKVSPFPITATSANTSDAPAASDIKKVLEYFGDYNSKLLIIDGGTLLGIPSTIVDLTLNPPKVIRKGALDIELSSN